MDNEKLCTTQHSLFGAEENLEKRVREDIGRASLSNRKGRLCLWLYICVRHEGMLSYFKLSKTYMIIILRMWCLPFS